MAKGRNRESATAPWYGDSIGLHPNPVQNVGQAAASPEMCKQPAPDPAYEETRALRNEAERALKRLLAHSAAHDMLSNMTAAAKAIEQLRGW